MVMLVSELSAAGFVFGNAIRSAVHATRAAYDKMLMREALKSGLGASLLSLFVSFSGPFLLLIGSYVTA